MRKSLSIFFLVLLCLPAIYKVGFFTFYQLNRDYIVENYCVNKDRPITMCYGSCFLEKGLSLADPAPGGDKLKSMLKLEMQEFVLADLLIQMPFAEANLTLSFFLTPPMTPGVKYSIFRPPLV